MNRYLIASLMSLCLVVPGLVSADPAASAEATASPRLLVHILDYVAQDYAGAVVGGKVTSQLEYDEQRELTGTAIKLGGSLEEIRRSPAILKRLQELRQAIEQKRPAESVSVLARTIKAEVIAVAGIQVAPPHWPSVRNGQALYSRSNCIGCHGPQGRGDGAAAAGLNPAPSNFHNAERMDQISPFRAFNTIRMGVQGTSMVANPTLSDQEVWDLAFYVLSIRHESAPKGAGLGGEELRQVLPKAASQSDAELLRELPGDEAQRRERLVALRTHVEDELGGGGGQSLEVAKTYLAEALADYRAGRREPAERRALAAYLDGIEPIEPRLRANDPALLPVIEQKMSAVRASISAGKPMTEIEAAVKSAGETIEIAARSLRTEPPSPWLSFLLAAGILLREGFEAVLILIALLAVIRASGSRRAAAWVHFGWISALACGAVGWYFSGWLIGISGAQRELMEGTLSLLAVAVLLYMGFWLHRKTEIHRWKSFIDGQVRTALEGSKLFGLAFISFMAVFREAFETVLFLRAASLGSGEASRNAMAAGVFGALALVMVVAWVLLRFSRRLPIRQLFNVSSVMMAILAIVLTGKGLHSLQETGRLSITESAFQFRLDLLGFYPTWETLLSQLAVGALVVVLWNLNRSPRLGRA